MRGTPDHTQRKVKACAPDLALTHCRYIPPYAALATQTIPAVHGHPGATTTPFHNSPRPNTAAASLLYHPSSAKGAEHPMQYTHRPNTAGATAGSPATSAQMVPRLNVAAVDSMHSHAGKGPCLLAGQQTARPDLGNSSQPAQERSAGGAASPEKSTRSNGLYTGHAGLQPMSAHSRCIQRPNQAVSYHTSGAATWRGPALQPINIGSSR